jgi:hypothetical protein
MKIHTKKKLYRRTLSELAKKGYINDANGRMVLRSSVSANSMVRDYKPQR